MEGQDPAVGHLEGLGQVLGHGVEGGAEVLGGHPQALQAHAVEALGVLEEGGVTPGPHHGQDGLDGGVGRLLAGGGARKVLAPVAAGTAKVEPLQHGRGIIARMSSSTAELSSLATALDELAQRVTAMADACADAKRDDLAAELYQAERALGSAQRSVARAADSARQASAW